MDPESNPTFVYQPPPGGDISLKSSDGALFLAHSLLLRLASSVFADMFSTATHNDTIELTDDAESVSLMLRFIYPPAFMDDLPITLLKKSLSIAQKYDIAGIVTSVDHILVSYLSSKDAFIRSYPIHALCLAANYGLSKTHKAARETMQPGGFGFKDPEQIKLLVETFPSASSVIEMLGAHCVRTRSLLDLLLGSSQGTILPCARDDDGRGLAILMCGDCFNRPGCTFELDELQAYEPPWFPHWSAVAFYNISTRPFGECEHLFQVAILDAVTPGTGVCQDCIRAAREAEAGLAFDFWAHKVKVKVVKILSEAERLYNL
ncbi:hypothetical protein FRC08_008388 [Ceratobasidium sp. 394]|nr:hypothetical protein FRC08_008388 [Ceratobasidium sp. 394]